MGGLEEVGRGLSAGHAAEEEDGFVLPRGLGAPLCGGGSALVVQHNFRGSVVDGFDFFGIDAVLVDELGFGLVAHAQRFWWRRSCLRGAFDFEDAEVGVHAGGQTR